LEREKNLAAAADPERKCSQQQIRKSNKKKNLQRRQKLEEI
jgi:hypothetical protein